MKLYCKRKNCFSLTFFKRSNILLLVMQCYRRNHIEKNLGGIKIEK